MDVEVFSARMLIVWPSKPFEDVIAWAMNAIGKIGKKKQNPKGHLGLEFDRFLMVPPLPMGNVF